MDPIAVPNPVTNEIFPFDEFSDEVKLPVLMRFELQELINYSKTNRANHQFVWLTPPLVGRIITLKIIQVVHPYIHAHQTNCNNHWQYTVALAKQNLNQAIQFANEHLDTCLQGSSLMRISENEKERSIAIKTLMIAANICKDDKSFRRAYEFLRHIVRKLVLLNKEKAFEVYEMIDDKKEKLVAKAEMAKYMPYEQKEEFLQEVVQELLTTSIYQYRFYKILDNIADHVTLANLKKLLEKAHKEYAIESDSTIYYEVVHVGITSYCSHAKRSLPEDHHWIFWLIEHIRENKYLIQAYSYLASLFFELDPKLAQESLEKAKVLMAQNPNDGNGYKYIAKALAQVDPKTAEEFFVKAIDTLFASMEPEPTISDAIRGLAKINLKLALEYNEKIKEELSRASNLLVIALKLRKIDLLDEAINRLVKVPGGAHKFNLFLTNIMLEFGEDYVVNCVNKIEEPIEKIISLMKLSKMMLSINPQRAQQLAKEGMALSMQNNKDDKFRALYSFINY